MITIPAYLIIFATYLLVLAGGFLYYYLHSRDPCRIHGMTLPQLKEFQAKQKRKFLRFAIIVGGLNVVAMFADYFFFSATISIA